jgi:hypothetical protein
VIGRVLGRIAPRRLAGVVPRIHLDREPSVNVVIAEAIAGRSERVDAFGLDDEREAVGAGARSRIRARSRCHAIDGARRFEGPNVARRSRAERKGRERKLAELSIRAGHFLVTIRALHVGIRRYTSDIRQAGRVAIADRKGLK